MILQSLTDYYRTLADRGEISPPGVGPGQSLLCPVH